MRGTLSASSTSIFESLAVEAVMALRKLLTADAYLNSRFYRGSTRVYL